MVDFTTKDGRTIHPVHHEATFRGKHNESKSKVLILLQCMPDGQFLSAGQIAKRTGCNYAYLCTRLSFWWSWRYLGRKLGYATNGKPCYVYSIDNRGKMFVATRIPSDVYNRYVSELNEVAKARINLVSK